MATNEATAALFTITSANTHVEISDSTLGSPLPSIPDNTSTASAVHTVSGSPAFPAYESSLSTTYDPNAKLSTDYTLKFPDTAGTFPSSLIKGTTTVNFTPTTNITYLVYGGFHFVNWDSNTLDQIPGNSNNSRNLWKLTDVTNNLLLYEHTEEIWSNVHNFSDIGALNGNLVAGNSYRWESFFEGSNNGLNGWGPITLNAPATVEFHAAAVPEPGTMTLVGVGALALSSRVVRRRRH